MELLETLRGFGLTKNEASVYLALLQIGPSPVLQVSRGTGLKRPTTYLILDDLMNRGLVALVPQEKKRLYIALPPERLAEQAERRLDSMREILPELRALYRTQTAKPSVQLFESRDGMMSVYEEITNFRTTEVLSFFSVEAIQKEFKESFDVFIRSLKEGRMTLREIVYTKDTRHYYIQRTKNLPNHKMRFTDPKNKFMTDNFIYGDKVALFSFKKRFAATIESDEVTQSLRSLFELAWGSAQEL